MYYNVTEARAVDNHTIVVLFEDGKRGTYDMSGHFSRKLYAPLNSPSVFGRAQAMDGTVVWPGDIDVSPERLYEDCIPIA